MGIVVEGKVYDGEDETEFGQKLDGGSDGEAAESLGEMNDEEKLGAAGISEDE